MEDRKRPGEGSVDSSLPRPLVPCGVRQAKTYGEGLLLARGTGLTEAARCVDAQGIAQWGSGGRGVGVSWQC